MKRWEGLQVVIRHKNTENEHDELKINRQECLRECMKPFGAKFIKQQ